MNDSVLNTLSSPNGAFDIVQLMNQLGGAKSYTDKYSESAKLMKEETGLNMTKVGGSCCSFVVFCLIALITVCIWGYKDDEEDGKKTNKKDLYIVWIVFATLACFALTAFIYYLYSKARKD